MSERRMWPTPRAQEPAQTTLGYGRGLAELVEGKEQIGTVAQIASPQLTLFAEAFPVSRTPWLADVPAPTMSVTSGRSSSDSFASVNPDGSWRKTCQGYSQVTLDGSLERFSETWPRAGMTRSGTAYQRPPSAPLTDVTGSGSWPTPTGADVMGTTEFHPRKESKPETNHATTLAQKVQWTELYPTITAAGYDATMNHGKPSLLKRAQMWATPTRVSGEHPGRIKRKPHQQDFLSAQVGGSLNPTWVEWLMGYPLGHTEV